MSNASPIHPVELVAVGKEFFRGRRPFVVSDDLVESFVNTLQNTPYKPWSIMGKYAPKFRSATTKSGFAQGQTLIVADYETPRIEGEVKVRPALVSELRKIVREPFDDGKIIEGQDPNDTFQQHSYKVVQGDNVVPTPKAHFIVEAATSVLNMNTIWDLVGHINSSVMPAPIGAGPEKAMLLGAPRATWESVFNLWYIDYLFAYSGSKETWNSTVKSQKGFWSVKEKPVFTADLNVSTTFGKKFVTEFVYGELIWDHNDGYSMVDTDPEPRRIAIKSPFSTLPGFPG
jgi:hypothetical protein